MGESRRIVRTDRVAASAQRRAWYGLGASLHHIGKQDEAIAAHQKAMHGGVPPSIGEYALAVAYASQQDTENSFKYLDKAAQDGFSQPERLAADEELSHLRTDPRFAKVVDQATHNLRPCAYNSRNRQFDLWIGEWGVVSADGTSAAATARLNRY